MSLPDVGTLITNSPVLTNFLRMGQEFLNTLAGHYFQSMSTGFVHVNVKILFNLNQLLTKMFIKLGFIPGKRQLAQKYLYSEIS